MLSTERWMLTDTRMGASTNKGATNAAILAGIRYHKRMYRTLGAHVALSMPGWSLMVEPWFKAVESQRLCSPDAVLRDEVRGRAIVIEVKKNWKDGRDEKLLNLYLQVVRSALGLRTYPLMLVGNVRGLAHDPLLSMADIPRALDWVRGQPTPTMLKL